MASLPLEFDDELIDVLHAQGEPVAHVARELIVLELYRRGAISGGKAGELLGMNRFDFIRRASDLGIPFIDMTEGEWAAELQAVEEMKRAYQSSPMRNNKRIGGSDG